MRKIVKLAAAAAVLAGAAAVAAPASAQGLGFGIEIGPRYESYPGYRYYDAPRYDQPAPPAYTYPAPYRSQPNYSYPGATYGPNYQTDCYTSSLNGRVCVD